jgi:hypothetical protein
MKVSVNKGHMAGCHCKKSRCLKKYCECFEGAVYCGPNCKCLDCQNVSGSDVSQRRAAPILVLLEAHLSLGTQECEVKPKKRTSESEN